MIDKKTIEKLQKVFYSKEFNMAGLDKFKRKLKELDITIPSTDIEYFYKGQEVVQVLKPFHALNKKERKGTIVHYAVGEKVYIDTMFISKYGFLLVNVIDGFSRYAYSKAFQYSRSEDPEYSVTVTSKKTADTLYNFQKELMELGYNIKTVIHDAGSEFKGYFKAYLEENKINDITTDVSNKLQTSIIERLNYSMRLLIEKYVSVYGKKNLIGKIPQLIEAYNSTYHGKLKYTPEEVLLKPEIQKELQSKSKAVGSTTIEGNLKVGDNVRLYIKKEDDPFNKLSPNWSDTIYKIEAYNKRNGKYTVQGKSYTENQLLKITHVIPYDPNKKQEKALSKLKDFLQKPKEKEQVNSRVTRSQAKKLVT